MNLPAEIEKVTNTLTQMKVAAHDRGGLVTALKDRLQTEEQGLQQLTANIQAAETTLAYLQQLQQEAQEEAGKAEEDKKEEA
ncbi:MAG: hypothetical protein ACYC5Y_05280 [Symbiobacteriia bacterium]